MEKYDYIIVGAGPGGNALAYALKAKEHLSLLRKRINGAAHVRTMAAIPPRL